MRISSRTNENTDLEKTRPLLLALVAFVIMGRWGDTAAEQTTQDCYEAWHGADGANLRSQNIEYVLTEMSGVGMVHKMM